jgi:hypothetical protein
VTTREREGERQAGERNGEWSTKLMRIPYEHVRQYKETAGLKTCAWVTSRESSEGAEIKDRHDITELGRSARKE